jgi:hypothetical protein
MAAAVIGLDVFSLPRVGVVDRVGKVCVDAQYDHHLRVTDARLLTRERQLEAGRP